jgi:hypothetical protein
LVPSPRNYRPEDKPEKAGEEFPVTGYSNDENLW